MPFVIEHERRDITNGGYFTPAAKLLVTPGLRTSGLLGALPDREAKSLLLMLTFLTPNGAVRPTAAQLARSLRLPEAVLRSRMGKLTSFRWQGDRIAHHVFHETGIDGYRLSPRIVSEREAETPTVLPPLSERALASRDDVIAQSRASYGRPRAEVEADIERRLGVTEPLKARELSAEEAEVRRSLIEHGVSPTQADKLTQSHTAAEIRSQLTWLPDRAARSPARFVVRAIEGRFDPPARVRLESAIAAEEAVPGGWIKKVPPGASLPGRVPNRNVIDEWDEGHEGRT